MGDVDVFEKNSTIMGIRFMKTTKTKIDVFIGTLSIEFVGNVVNLKINDADIPNDNFSVNFLDTKSHLSEDCCKLSNRLLQELSLNRIFVIKHRKNR